MTIAPLHINAALDYAQRGWSIVPLWPINEDLSCACGNRDCKSPGKHPLGSLVSTGIKEATSDLAIISQWWAGWPDANVGIATGHVSGIAVLDIDGAIGQSSLDHLQSIHHPLPATLTAVTGKGWHHYFRHPGGRLENSVGSLGSQLDVRADGGFVVGPPSRHVSGRRYSWSLPGATPQPMPEWLITAIVQGHTPRRETLDDPGAPIQSGNRNSYLASLAGTMRRRGMIRHEILAALLAVNDRCLPPLDECEVERIARSIGQYPASANAGPPLRGRRSEGGSRYGR
jgi:putative DNA primase/helicase